MSGSCLKKDGDSWWKSEEIIPSFFTRNYKNIRMFFVGSSGKGAAIHFFVALFGINMYNSKIRQAEAHSREGIRWRRILAGRLKAAEVSYVDGQRSEQHSGLVHYSGSGTGSFGAETE
ncbi:MAG: hypothetical protein OSJ58_06170 [Dysosmobacter sp.]|nr:hypothetical protein [Dysosmobacter sp.]